MHFTTDKDNFFTLKIHIVKEKDMDKVLVDFKNLDIWKLMERYVKVFNS